MNNPLLEKLSRLSQNPQSLSMQNVEEFVHEVLIFFERVRTKMTSGTLEEREQALQESQELQQQLKDFTTKIYEQSGMTEEDIKKFMAKNSNLASFDMKHFKNAQQEIDEYRENVASDKNPRQGKKI